MDTFTHIAPRSRFSDQEALTLQSRHLITGPHAAIAAHVGIHVSKVGQYSNGTYHVPSFRLPAISEAQDNWTFAKLLFQRVGAILLPPRSPIVHWRAIQLLSLLVISFGNFLPLAEQVREGERLTAEQKIKLREEWEKVKQAGEALVQQAEQQEEDKE